MPPKAGQIDITSLILADQDLRASRAKLIDLELEAPSALVKLERAVGGPAVAASLAASLAEGGPATRRADRSGARPNLSRNRTDPWTRTD